MFLKEPFLSYLFIILSTFFHHKEPFVKQKGSSDVKGSLWNHLEKKGSSMASWSTFIFKSEGSMLIILHGTINGSKKKLYL